MDVRGLKFVDELARGGIGFSPAGEKLLNGGKVGLLMQEVLRDDVICVGFVC